ncbi:hypothetical protein [Dickeya zeae]|uniref:Secreted protein n=1 Tax=Dickeya zeae TaxID=204042 RepID=A0AAE7CXL4_9GAMM|nr:hypothetical protein [Dickeya zeae]QIZ49445.1 hypothetical protein DWG24_00895 [Dickeya zeae]QYM92817.1 hypothetical protein FGI21_13575 [Dickeya zeae]
MKMNFSFLFLGLMAVSSSQASSLTSDNNEQKLDVGFGAPTYKQTLHYRKLYEKKPFPDAEIFYYDNGIYKIISQGEEHYGVYVMQGNFQDQTYTIRYISLPSEDWGKKTAFHQLTFINGDKEKYFIQNAIVDTGEAIAQQNGTFTLAENNISNPITQKWRHN